KDISFHHHLCRRRRHDSNYEMAVIPSPTENIYHAEIFENEQKEPLSQLNALILADHAEVVAYESEVKWV
ncbi:MAG: hypothetical protein LUF30_08375, partial [Lachnospiraceae bacterium]|nr:hypothetical protein [Lachnospiraceae bacterium]